MNNALVPIVSKPSGITTGEFGITLNSIDVDDILRALDYVAARAGPWLEHHSDLTIQEARTHYNHDAFLRRFKTIMEAVTG